MRVVGSRASGGKERVTITTKSGQTVKLENIRDSVITLSGGAHHYQWADGDNGKLYRRQNLNGGEWSKWKSKVIVTAPLDSMSPAEMAEL